MRILISTDAFPPRCGGSGWSTFHLARSLRQSGHEPRVVCVTPETTGVRTREYEGLEVADLGYPYRDVPWIRSVLRDHWLFHLLRTHLVSDLRARPVDVLHAQHGLSGPPSVAAAAEVGTASVVTVRDHWPICYFTTWHVNGERCPDCSFGKMLACMREKDPSAYWAGVPLMPYMRATVRRKQRWLRRADAVVAVSEYIARHVVRPVVGETRAHVIPNFVDFEPLRRAFERPPQVELPERFVLFAGKLNALKGARFALDVSSRLGSAIAMVVVGEGPDRAHLEARARRDALNVRFVPWLANDDLLAIMSRALAVIVPSILPEALNRTVLEAMFVGTPVLATDSGGIRDQIEPERSGMILPLDPKAFANALEALADDPEHGRRLTIAARERAEARFSPGAVLPRIEALYREVAAKRPSPAQEAH